MYMYKISDKLQTVCFYFHFLFFAPKNDNVPGLVDMFAEYGKRTSVKIKLSFKMHFKISIFCTNFVLLH